MKKLVMFAFVAALATACSKDDKPSCDKVFDHTLSLAPPEMRDMFAKKRESAIEKCKKLSDGAKKCALAAKSMEELQKCPRE